MRYRFHDLLNLIGATVMLALVSAAPAQAQTPGYDLQIFTPGATAPLQTSPLAATDITCNVAPPTGALNTVNPNRVIWDDPTNAGKVCVWTPSVIPGSPLVVLPNGSYEGALTFTDAAGTSPLSNKAPFSKAPAPAARTGVKLYRQGS